MAAAETKGSFLFSIDFTNSESFISAIQEEGEISEEVIILQLEAFLKDRKEKYFNRFRSFSAGFSLS